MKKFNKALSVLLASATLASACPTHQKASALTPAEAAVIGIFGAGALAGGVAAVCLGVQNANIKNELKKEKEAKKENPVGQSSELTRSQLDKAMRELATVKAQLENAKKEQESSNRVLQDTLDRSKQYEKKTEEEKKQLQGKLDEERKKSRQKDLELSQEKESKEKDKKKHARELRESTQKIAQLEEQTKTLSKKHDKLQEKYDDLMLYSLACLYLAIAEKNPTLQEHLNALKPFKLKKDEVPDSVRQPNTSEPITPQDLVNCIKMVQKLGGNVCLYTAEFALGHGFFWYKNGNAHTDNGNLCDKIYNNVAVMLAVLERKFQPKASDTIATEQRQFLLTLTIDKKIKFITELKHLKEAADKAVKSLDANPGLFSRIFG